MPDWRDPIACVTHITWEWRGNCSAYRNVGMALRRWWGVVVAGRSRGVQPFLPGGDGNRCPSVAGRVAVGDVVLSQC